MEIDEGPEPEPSAAADEEFLNEKELEEDSHSRDEGEVEDQDLNFDTTDSTIALSARGDNAKLESEDPTEEEDPNYDHDDEEEEVQEIEDVQQEPNDYMEEFIEQAGLVIEHEDDESNSAPTSATHVGDVVKKKVPDYIGPPIQSSEEESEVESLGGPDYDEEDSDSDQWDIRPQAQKDREEGDRGDSDDDEDEEATEPINMDQDAEDVETELVDQGDAHDKGGSEAGIEEEAEEEDQEESEEEEEDSDSDSEEDTKPNPELLAAVREELRRRGKLPQESEVDEPTSAEETKPDIKTETPTPQASQNEDQTDQATSVDVKEEGADAEGESELPLEQRVLMQEELRNYCFKELRSLQLGAYSDCIDALRASGKLTKEKHDLMASLRDAFNVSIGRHRSEVRRALSNDKLGVIADNVTDGNSFKDCADWRQEGYAGEVTEPRCMTYRIGRHDDQVRLVVEDVNAEPEPSIFSKTYHGKDLPPRHCTVITDTKTDIDWEEESEKYKERISVPPDMQLKIDVDNSSEEEGEEEDEISHELDTNTSTRRSRRSRTPTTAALAGKQEGRPTAKTKTLELQKGRQQLPSPDITSPTASSPVKKVQKPSTSKGATKRKMPPSKAGSGKMRKIIKFPNAAAVKKAKATAARAKASTAAAAAKEKEDGSTAAGTSRPTALSRVFRGRGGRAGSRGRGGRGGQKGRLTCDNSLNSNSLETTEEMPASPQLVANTSKPKPKRKILKVKRPSAAAQKQNQEQKSATTAETVTKQRRKAKQEEIKDEGDYELENTAAAASSGRGRARVSSPFTHYNKLMANASYPLSVELPSKVRHKGKLGTQGAGAENYEHAELPRFNLNDEIQSHFSNALNRPTISSNPPPPRTIYSSSSMPLPVFSTSLNMNNFHKKRTQLLLPSTYQDLGMPGAGAAGNDENSGSAAEGQFTTASSLAASRVRAQPPAVLSAASLLFRQQGFVGNANVNLNPGASTSLATASGSGVVNPASGAPVRAQTPPILQRKATPHILSNSKLHRNANANAMMVNSVYSNSTNNANANATTTSPTGTTPVTSLTANSNAGQSASAAASTSSSSSGSNHVLTGESLEAAEAVAAAQLLDLQSHGTTSTANFNVASNSNNNSASTLTLTPTPPPMSIPAVGNYARTTAGPPGSNIIFVQKSMPAAVGTMPTPIMVNSTHLGGLQGPFKGAVGGPRAVIVRKTPAAGGAGNVIFLDLPKNQILSAAQFPQLIQGARFINTQTTTLLNPPVAVASAGNAPRKVVNILPQQSAGARRIQMATSVPALIHPRTGVPIKPLTSIRPLTTTGANSIPPMIKVMMPANNTSAGSGSQSQPPPLQMVQRLAVKAVPVPNSTVTVDNSQNTFLYANVQNNDLSEIKISNVMSESSAQAVTILGDGSAQTVGPGDDIFQLALKSSGIDFSGSQIYVTESNPGVMEHQQIILTDSNAQGDVQYMTQYNEMASGEASQSLPVPMEVVVSTAIESTHNS